ncbi:alpha/beta-hydrolase [Aulographum hederae CBS 113979]|uniref:Carboxylic ester hydrolase n=1 Tax=Aulographum hederae CBS 113979 TaxID=1176131 RepID=A0A6G1GIU0_9PEZI|nr:alpha/beta-hydrolase [Aulographum hederae CBS 113979]
MVPSWPFLSLFSLFCVAVTSNIQVNAPTGRISGFIDRETLNVVKFLGIPYAEPPVGQSRWLPAQPKNFTSHNATAFGPACPQNPASGPSIGTEDASGMLTVQEFSEDCLTLSIWTPASANQSKPLPVFAWIYGGGWQTGGINTPYQLPHHWVQKSQKHIVVAINYRLNIFGFPNFGALQTDELNLGLLDMRVGLEWIRDNIAAFGGDPKRIVLWGQSAGAVSIDEYSYAYPKDPIVSGMILDSGTALIPAEVADPTQTSFRIVAQHFGCVRLRMQIELDCMRKVSSENIQKFIQNYSASGRVPPLIFQPVVDNRVKFLDYAVRSERGLMAHIPAIIGTNRNEGMSLIQWNPDPTLIDYGTANLTTSTLFLCPAAQTTANRLKEEHCPTYRYYYTAFFPNISPRPWEGAYHGSELPVIFGTSEYQKPNTSTPAQKKLSETMQEYWVKFAEDPWGVLEVGGKRWEPWSNSGTTAMEFCDGSDGDVTRGISEGRLTESCAGSIPIPGKSLP